MVNGSSGTTASDGFWFGFSDKAYFWNYENVDTVFANNNTPVFTMKANGDAVASNGLGVGGATPDASNAFAFYGTNLLLNSGSDINMKFNKNAVGDDASMTWQTGFSTKALAGLLGNDDWTLKVGSGFNTAIVADEDTGEVSMPNTPKFNEFTHALGGAYLLDPGEINGWGARGPVDESLTTDLGNTQTTNWSRAAGGLMFPFDVRLKRFQCFHYNSNAAAEAWGWAIARQSKAATTTVGTNNRTTTVLLNEVVDNGGVGPRNYLNNVNQQTDITLDEVIPAGEIIVLVLMSLRLFPPTTTCT